MATPPWWPSKAQGTGHVPTATIRSQGDWPRLHGGHTGPRDLTRLHSIHTKPARPATTPRQSCGAQGNRHTSTAALRRFETCHAPITSIRGPLARPRLDGGHTWPRGTATPQRQQYGAQGTGHTPTATIWGPGNWPRPHGSHTGPRKPTTPHNGLTRPGYLLRPHGIHTGPTGLAMAMQWP